MGILFFIGGVLTTALISFYFYRKQKNDQKIEMRQAFETLRAKLLKNSKRNFSIEELNKMIDDLVIDKNLLKKKDPLPYKKCPKCGSSALEKASDIEVDIDDEGSVIPLYFWEAIFCKNCDWEKTAYIDKNGKIISYNKLCL